MHGLNPAPGPADTMTMDMDILAAPPADPAPPAPPPTPKGRRRSGRDVKSTELETFSLVLGCLVGVAAGVLARAALHLTGLAHATSPMTLGLLAPVMGVATCLVYAKLMEEARDSVVHVRVDGMRRTFPCRRRHEVVRRATFYLVAGLGTFAALVAGGIYLYWNVAPTRIPPMAARPEVTAYALVALAVAGTLMLGEAFFRITSKEGRMSHAPWVMLPSVVTLGLPLAGLLG